MTTPAPPATTTASFKGVLHPHDVARILNLLVTGAPFSNVLSRYPTGRSAVAFPTVRPDRPQWLAEMADIPIVGLGDDADVVAVAKLASIVLLSNEGFSDASVNMTAEFAQILRDTASAELDRGVCYGEDAPEPRGVVAAALPAEGADLGAAISAAVGSIGDSGGVATHLCAKPSVLAAARDTRALTDGSNDLAFPDGIGAAYGLAEVGVPELKAADILVIDKARTWLIVRNDFAVDTSQDFAFQQDALAVRVRGRFAVAAPDVPKALRRLEVTGDGLAAATEPVVARHADAKRGTKP